MTATATPTTSPACPASTEAPPALAAPRRPHFYAGQLLTNTDLAAIVDWSRARRALDRFVLGWGAVCGLAVAVDPTNPSRAIVGRGYALGPWGDDLVLEADATLDLSTSCPAAVSDCAKKPGANTPQAPPVFGVPADQVTMLDIVLVPQTTKADPRRLAGINLGLPGEKLYHYARVVEGAAPCVVANPASPADPVTDFQARFKAWQAAASTFVGKVNAAVTALLGSIAAAKTAADASATADAVAAQKQAAASVTGAGAAVIAAASDAARDADAKRKLAASTAADASTAGDTAKASLTAALASWAKSYPGSRRPFVAGLFAKAVDAATTDPAPFAALAFAVIDDGRRTALAPQCPADDEGPGVPLARAWLTRTTNAATGVRACTILAIDDAPPSRRPLSRPDPWPAPTGSTNLAHWLGEPADPAALKLMLASLGFPGAAITSAAPTFDTLPNLIKADPTVPFGAGLSVALVDATAFGAAALGVRVAAIGTP